MSFDIFVVAFRDGESTPIPTATFLEVFARHLDVTNPESPEIRCADGGGGELVSLDLQADSQDSIAVHRPAGHQVFDLLVELARRANAVILAPGYPTLIVHTDQLAHIGDDLRSDVRVIATGQDVIDPF
ncbi:MULTISPECIES: hypothetical protein [unclassified Mycolicibacterium]|uniref:hypothetical protein n=1 Tax=unclassified Mycolicibacterium TaxID=2636767 RepID=UPI0012DC33A5|nr:MULTISPECIES: hypothetical protein [unclassified Mycolicibacterium]MUL84784.1 hypothetical protein [Mycolicibacterium sp. CBMA 329]MUL88560.1 hypothetical protein [Mycolicibacterium sp. CBMA 331]MUM00100.1 hypothetical protein [Mycolicibacterium sp. CBMA 334]MUM29163.1 hypothetical protein [Mycolicibacterium sp. CBMA 295]MUM40207.1 hypothetical protein [Mycolicibacterium sp. CBMA 247]